MNKLPFLIAEISSNHCGDINIAKKLIKCAKKNGADAVKLQTYEASSMTVNSNKKIFKIKEGIWKGYSLWDLYDEAHTPLEWHKNLFAYAKKIGIKIFSTPFDNNAVDFLEKLNCPFYKVASFEMTDIPLIERISKTKKKMIISTGMANLNEIENTFKVATKFNKRENIVLLYCVSNYPSKTSDFNLNNIRVLKKNFKCTVGLSDHSKDNRIAAAAVAAGAEVFEKHIALENQKKGLDLKFSLKGNEIKNYKEVIEFNYHLLGKKYFFRNKSENKSKIFRRSIFAIKDIKKGDNFTKKNIKSIRPYNGLEPKYFNKILNKKCPINIEKFEPIPKKILILLKIKKI